MSLGELHIFVFDIDKTKTVEKKKKVIVASGRD